MREASGGWGENLLAEEGPQGLGNPDRPVRSLMILENRDDPASSGQGPVEGGGDPRAVVLVPVAHGQPTRLERGAVRGRGQLTVGVLAGNPGFAVELAGGAGAEIP